MVTEKVKKAFNIDIHQLESKQYDRLSSLFSQLDQHFIVKHTERKDLMRQYKDIPMAIDRLYKDPDYIKDRHGHDLQIKIDPSVNTKKKKRMVSLIKDSFREDEVSLFQKLHQAFSQLSEEFGGKTIFEITDIFMRVNGDIKAVRDYLEGKRVAYWSYLDDVGLSLPESSTEFRCLVTTKGRDEIEKRKRFLLDTGYCDEVNAAVDDQSKPEEQKVDSTAHKQMQID